ncbi:hypothetical protein RSAG8_02956, partial [Rhizoctonia solani AG-8 WAC10335]
MHLPLSYSKTCWNKLAHTLDSHRSPHEQVDPPRRKGDWPCGNECRTCRRATTGRSPSNFSESDRTHHR